MESFVCGNFGWDHSCPLASASSLYRRHGAGGDSVLGVFPFDGEQRLDLRVDHDANQGGLCGHSLPYLCEFRCGFRNLLASVGRAVDCFRRAERFDSWLVYP